MDQFEYNRPNTRERIAARRKTQRSRSRSSARPGPRRAVGAWLVTGRLAGLVLLIAALGGLVYLFSAPQFIVRDVQVAGAQAMSPESIGELAGAQGQSIWFVDTARIAERLMTSAYIERASASVSLPDRLTISVEERRPDVRWRAGGTLYLVDTNGRVLDTAGSAPLTNTLVIEDNSNRQLAPNDRVDPDALKLGRLLTLRLPAELGMTPASIGWDIAAGIYVRTSDGRTIVFGQTEHLDDKLAVLGTLLKDGTPFTYLDLRPNLPFYRNDVTPTPQQF